MNLFSFPEFQILNFSKRLFPKQLSFQIFLALKIYMKIEYENFDFRFLNIVLFFIFKLFYSFQLLKNQLMEIAISWNA